MVLLVILLLVGGAIGWAVLAATRRREELEAYLREHGFRSQGSELPETLKPPPNVWLPQIKISHCYTGMRNDFEVAVFQSTVPQGETPLVRTMVAVRRPPKHDLRLTNFLARLVTIDSTSTPGWVIAAWHSSMIRPQVLEPLLKALTAREGEEPAIMEVQEKQLHGS